PGVGRALPRRRRGLPRGQDGRVFSHSDTPGGCVGRGGHGVRGDRNAPPGDRPVIHCRRAAAHGERGRGHPPPAWDSARGGGAPGLYIVMPGRPCAVISTTAPYPMSAVPATLALTRPPGNVFSAKMSITRSVIASQPYFWLRNA